MNENLEQCEYLKEETLTRKCTKICITCNQFLYSTTENFATILICPIHEKLIPQGDHLLRGSKYWLNDKIIYAT